MKAEISQALEGGATVVTATRRLSRELTHQWDAARLAAGKTAWPSADVLPWEAWVGRCRDQLQSDLFGRGQESRASELLLNDSQALALWREIIERDVEHNDGAAAALWNHWSAAGEAAKAWRLAHDWQIDLEQIGRSGHADHRAFTRWFRQYETRCGDQRWTDSARIAPWLIDHVAELSPQSLLLVGFDQLNPVQQALIDALSARSTDSVTVLSAQRADFDHVSLHSFADEHAQWLAVGDWTRQQLDANPNLRVGIVVPDLGRSRGLVEGALRQTLCPSDLLQPWDTTTLPFHISLGQPLLDAELGQGTQQLIGLLTRPRLTVQDIGQLLRSPWIGGHHTEIQQRSLLARNLFGRASFHTSLNDLQNQVVAFNRCPEFERVLDAAITLREQQPDRATYRNWSEWLAQLLARVGWPGSAEQRSDLYQTSQAIMAQIESLGELDLIQGPADLNDAISRFTQRLSQQIFQPEAHDPPVQVMGFLETAGLNFDALWVGSLTDETWPPPTRPNPFIPVAFQREAGVPYSSPESSTALARAQLQRLVSSAGTIQFSTFRRDGESEVLVSPLIRHCPAAEHALTQPDTVATQMANAAVPLETFDDDQGTALSVERDIRGGTALIRRQSVCPRGAYLRFRLGGDIPELPVQGLDPAERGNLVHRLLDLVWQRIGTSSALGTLSGDALGKLIDEQIEASTGRFFFTSGCGNHFLSIQQRWLKRTILAWFDVERTRTVPFEVVSREERTTLNLGTLPLNFQIDRIDRFADGSLGLIDYKTGGNLAVGEWGQTRPNEPQLPLYWLSQQVDDGAPVSLVAFARVRLGECQLNGVTCDESQVSRDNPVRIELPENHPSLKETFNSWGDLTQSWTQNMSALAREFAAGQALVDPRNEGVCRDCPTPAFCRSGDIFADIADEESEADR